MLQSLRNVQTLLGDKAAILDGVVQTGARRRVDNAISQLATHASDQNASHLALQGSTRRGRDEGQIRGDSHLRAVRCERTHVLRMAR